MAILEKIRKRTGLLLVFVSGALLLFLIGDFSGLFKDNIDDSENRGEVNGKMVSNQLMNAKVEQRMTIDKALSQGQQQDQYKAQQIESQVWYSFVYEYGMKELLEKAGVFLSTDDKTKGLPEKVDLVQGKTVGDQIKQQFVGDNGQFDPGKIKTFLADAEKNKVDAQGNPNPMYYNLVNAFEDMAQQRHIQKYISLFEKTNYVTKVQAKKQHYADNSTASFEFAYIPFTSIADSTITLDENGLKEHMEKNIKKFDFRDGRTVQYVVFDAKPTKKDTNEVFQKAVKLSNELRASTNDTLYFNGYSDQPVNPTFYSVNDLPQGLKDDSTFIQKGLVKGPIVSYNGYEIFKVIGKGDAEFAQTAHILIASEKVGKEAAKIKAEEVLAKAKAGEDFKLLAAQFSEDPGSKDNGGEYPEQEKNGSWVKPFEDAVFNASSTGLLPELVETDFGYHIMKILKTSYKKERWAVARFIKELKPSRETMDTKFREINTFMTDISGIKELEEKVKADKSKKLELLTSPLLTKSSTSIGNVYNAESIVGWAFSPMTEVGEVKMFPLMANNQYVVAALKGISNKDKPKVDDARDAIERSYKSELKAETLKKILDEAKGDLQKRVNDLNSKNFPTYASYQLVSNHKFIDNYVPGAGNEPKMVGMAFAQPTSGGKEWSKVTIGDNGVFILVTKAKTESKAEVADYNAEKETIKQRLAAGYQMQVSNALNKKLNVKDYNQ